MLNFLDVAKEGGATELAAEDLRIAADALARLTGRLDVEDGLGRIFPSSVSVNKSWRFT